MPRPECPTCGYPDLRADGHAHWCWSPTRAPDEPVAPCPPCQRAAAVAGRAVIRLSREAIPHAASNVA